MKKLSVFIILLLIVSNCGKIKIRDKILSPESYTGDDNILNVDPYLSNPYSLDVSFTDNSIKLSWNCNTDSGFEKYNIYRSAKNNYGYFSLIGSSTTKEYIDQFDKLIFYYRVSAYYDDARESDWSSYEKVYNIDSYEDDDEYTNANTIIPNGAVQEHTLHGNDYNSDEDWIEFSAVNNTNYTIKVYDIEGNYLYVYLYNSFMSYQDYDGDSDEAVIYWTCTSSGIYYIKVYNSSYGSGYYKISVTY